jgi:hypothetical protein
MNDIYNRTLAVLTEATAQIRADYTARYTELSMARLITLRTRLAECGMDLQVYAPYPSGNLGKSEYRLQLAKRNHATAYFKHVDAYRTLRGPEIMVEKPDAEARLRTLAKQEADANVDSYLAKMAGKIAKEAASATTNGRIWESARLEVVCADGEKQVWHTQCILNQSVYGKLFNQWPTRRSL